MQTYSDMIVHFITPPSAHYTYITVHQHRLSTYLRCLFAAGAFAGLHA